MITETNKGLIKIAGGTALYRSTVGYNNFYYPSSLLANTIYDDEVEALPWLKFEGKRPVKVRSSNLLDVASDTEYVIMWID
jgi:hypothetical protein